MLEIGILSAFFVVMGGLFWFVYKIAKDNAPRKIQTGV